MNWTRTSDMAASPSVIGDSWFPLGGLDRGQSSWRRAVEPGPRRQSGFARTEGDDGDGPTAIPVEQVAHGLVGVGDDAVSWHGTGRRAPLAGPRPVLTDLSAGPRSTHPGGARGRPA